MLGLKNRGNLDTVVQDEFEHMFSGVRSIFLREHNEDGTHFSPPPTAFVPTGAIVAWSTNTAPDNWLLCQGQAADRVKYRELFDLIGVTYGVGDGSTTFNVPNLQQRFPLGKAEAGTGSTLAGTGGAIDHTHTGPSHTHSGPSHTHSITGAINHDHGAATGNEASHTHGFSATTGVPSASQAVESGSATTVTRFDHTHDVSGTTGAGSSHSHSITAGGAHDHGAATGAEGTGATGAGGTGATGAGNPPYLVLNYIIRT